MVLDKKWDQLTTFIPSIFNQPQIKQISKFYQKYDEINNEGAYFKNELIGLIKEGTNIIIS